MSGENGKTKKKRKSAGVMICPFCKEKIKNGAIKCKHCQSMLNTSSTEVKAVRKKRDSDTDVQRTRTANKKEGVICPFCKMKIAEGALICEHCGSMLNTDELNTDDKRLSESGKQVVCPICASRRVIVQSVIVQRMGFFITLFWVCVALVVLFALASASPEAAVFLSLLGLGYLIYTRTRSRARAYAVCQDCGNHWKEE
jgi:Flp pilus assembly protein TadB